MERDDGSWVAEVVSVVYLYTIRPYTVLPYLGR